MSNDFGSDWDRLLKAQQAQEPPLIEVTIWGADGQVVHHSFERGFRMTEEQHQEAIRLIEGGMRACDAARLVTGATG
ncbi:MAG TPA: hypothetical protein VEA36_03685 [Candidatus Paceibacterota bacterium]|nr:hypothetical protein [Candidatus Paceibacterota bacterium]